MTSTATFQPTIVIAGDDPDWVFAVQRVLRAAIGWEHDIVLTFAAHRALDYLHRRPTRLLIVTPQLMPGRDVALSDLIEAARTLPEPPHILLAVAGLPANQEISLVPAPIADPQATCSAAMRLLQTHALA